MQFDNKIELEIIREAVFNFMDMFDSELSTEELLAVANILRKLNA